MNEEYLKGKEIGELIGEVRAYNENLREHIDEQKKWNENMEKEVNLLKAWVQTTTGKVVILTTIFGIIGSGCYIAINWIISHWK